MRPIDPAISFLIVLLVGMVVGLIFDRVARPNWFTRDAANETRGMVTLALIGIAGSFIGFHLTLLLVTIRGSVLIPFLGALAGAVLVLWLWRIMR